MNIFSNKVFLLLILLLLAIFRFDFFIDAAELLLLYIRLLFSDVTFAAAQFNFELADTFFSLLLLLAAFLFLIFSRKGGKEKISIRSAVVIILITFFLFAPALSSFHPEFQKNISVTKLLPPLSSVKSLRDITVKTSESLKEMFLNKKPEVVKLPYNENIVFIDSAVMLGNKVHYYQNSKEIKSSETSMEGTEYFLFGTDQYGRDIFSRLIYGARISLLVGLGAVIVSFIFGFTFGFAAGYPGGATDIILNRISDVFLSFPVIFLVILILALFGSSLFTMIFVLGISGWMSMFKIVRSEVMGIKRKDYFIAAQMSGLTFFELMYKEVLPVISVPVIVTLVFQFANVVMAEAALSYLGLGAGGSYPSWGAMIESSQGYQPEAWWMFAAPSLFLMATLITVYSTGKIINSKILRKSYDQPAV